MQRNLESLSANFAKGLVFVEVSYATNGTSSPVVASIRGGNGALDLANNPPNRTAVGITRVTLRDKVRYIVTKYVDLDDNTSGTDDGSYASSGPDVNDPGLSQSANNLPWTTPAFDVFTRVAAGTKTDFSGRRVSISLALKNSSVGV